MKRTKNTLSLYVVGRAFKDYGCECCGTLPYAPYAVFADEVSAREYSVRIHAHGEGDFQTDEIEVPVELAARLVTGDEVALYYRETANRGIKWAPSTDAAQKSAAKYRNGDWGVATFFASVDTALASILD